MNNLFKIPPVRFGHFAIAAGIGTAAGVLLAGCAQISQGVAAAGEASGYLTPEQAQAVVKTGTAFGKAMEQITPQQEYYLGRAVGATIATTYGVYDDPRATEYINLVGQTLAAASDRPETFGGYHFLIMKSTDINAFSAPGGFVFISRGMLRLCHNEDELAAVLSHEIGHVQDKDAIRAISNSRWTSAFTILAAEAGKNLGGQQLHDLTTAFEGSISDITKKMIVTGYARSQEREADSVAIHLMPRVGYDPHALIYLLQNMSTKLVPGAPDYATTHPPPADRIRDIEKVIGRPAGPLVEPPARQERFNEAMRGV